MKTTAVRLYGKNDLRLEEFELPAIKDDEILAKVVSDSLCMSSYKATIQGAKHKRVPDDVSENPVIIGHEFCGEIVALGSKLKDKYKDFEPESITARNTSLADYVWLPIKFVNGVPEIHWYDEWRIEDFKKN